MPEPASTPAAPQPGTIVDPQPQDAVISPEQGWELMPDGTLLFEDGGSISPDGATTPAFWDRVPLAVTA